MSTNVGDLQVDLSFNDKGFTLTTRRAGEVIRTLQKDLSRTAAAVEKMEAAHHSLGRTFRNFMITVASVRFAMMDFNQVVLGVPRAVMKTSGELERMMFLMRGLSKETTEAGRAAEAQRGFQFIVDMAQKAPFEIKSLTDAFIKLKSAGIEPMGGMMQGLVDSVAKFGGTSETLHRASIAIQQMAGKGVISMEELRQQLGEAVPDAMQLMARASGVSMAELVKQISKGRVESTAALQNLSNIMRLENGGAARAMMETWAGTISQIQTQFALLAKEVGDAGFFEMIKSQAKQLLGFLKSDDGKQFAQNLGRGLTEVAIIIKGTAERIYELRNVILGLSAVLAGGMIAEKIKGMWQATIGAMIAQTTAMGKAAQEARRAQLLKEVEEEIVATKAKIMAAERAHQARMTEIRAYEVAYAAHAAKIAAIQKQMSVMQVGVGPSVRAAQQAQLAAMQAQAWEALKSQQAMERLSQATLANATANRAHLADLKQSAHAIADGTVKIGLAARASILWRGAIAALGGPIGAVITALSIAIPLWMMWGDKGEEAIKKVKAAMESGTAGKEERKEAIAEIGRLTMGLEESRRLRDQALADGNAEMVAALDKDIRQYEGRIAQWENDVATIDRQIVKNAARRGVEAWTEAMQDRNDKITNAYRAARAALQLQISKINNDKSLTDKEKEQQIAQLQKNDEFYLKEQQKALERSAREDYEQKKAYYEKLTANGSGASKDMLAEAKAQMEESQRAFVEMQSRSTEMMNFGTLKLIDKKDKGEKKGEDPLTAMLERARGDLAEAQIKLADLDSGIVSFDQLYRAQLAKLEGMRRAGKFDTKDDKKVSRPGAGDKRIAEIADLEAQMEAERRNAQVLDSMMRQKISASENLEDAQLRLARGNDAVTGAFDRETRAIEKARVGIVDIGGAMETFNQRAAATAEAAAMTDMTNFAIRMRDKMEEFEASSQIVTRDRERVKFENYKQQLQRNYEALAANLMASGVMTEAQTAIMTEAWDKMNAAIRAGQEDLHRRTMTQLERWVEAAKDMTTQIDAITTNWANSFFDMIVQGTRDGKLAWKDMINSMLQDLLRLTLNKQISGALGQLAGAAGDWLAGLFGGSDMGYGSIDPTMAGGGFPFAKGGIMSSMGPLALNRYANGGIARNAQVALFGEGSRPEAYVPLPDGRTIPVTMQGAAPSVTVNVINQTGQQVQAQQSGPRFDGKQMILDVVLSAASQPGNFREGLRGAVR